MTATKLRVLIPDELAACSRARSAALVVVVASSAPCRSVVVGRSNELVVGPRSPAAAPERVVDVDRRTVDDGDRDVVVLREPEPDGAVVDVARVVVELLGVVVLDTCALVVVGPPPASVVVVLESPGRLMSWAPAGASAQATSTTVTRHTTTAARCRTPTNGMVGLSLASGAERSIARRLRRRVNQARSPALVGFADGPLGPRVRRGRTL
ncbi:MAG: hypothetical protein M3507_08170 [Actinomycetota bacterium]|nr:hypothetical protein [Actinomycetota bacterium]